MSKSTKLRNVVGLGNIGNTCFMNSALQLILHCDKFVDSVMNWKKEGETIKSFQKLIADYHNRGSVRRETLNDIKETVGGKHDIFYRNWRQQDAHEFLEGLLRDIEEEFKEGGEENRMSKILDVNTQEDIVSRESERRSSKKGVVTIIPLNLPINPRLSTELKRCFSFYTSIQPVYGKYKFEEKVDGETVEYPELVTQKLSIVKINDYVLIQLKRFGQPFRNQLIKKNNKVYVPEMLDNTIEDYRLKSFVIQLSHSRDSGHYIAYVRTGDKWYRADDSSITEVDSERIKKYALDAYLICYERVPPVKLD